MTQPEIAFGPVPSRRHLEHVEYLIGYEGNAFVTTGDIEKDLLSITAVHPMREEAVKELLERSGSKEDIIAQLIADEKWIRAEHMGKTFYLRRFSKMHRS